MRTAQQLYEGVDIGGGTVGLITYMRTDSTNLANEALQEIRGYIGKNFNADYLPKAPDPLPQQIEERPGSARGDPAHFRVRVRRTRCAAHLTPDQARLYEMIWKRTLGLPDDAGQVRYHERGHQRRPQGQLVPGERPSPGRFPDSSPSTKKMSTTPREEGEEKLPPLAEGEKMPLDRIFGEQHFTQPPPRYTEASLVKTLEEYGIGRPSTYASIISTLQERGYALLDKKRFMPTDLGRLVNGFLTAHFNHYIDYDFTARMEDQLDFISNGEREWVPVLSEFWDAFSTTLAEKQDVARGVPLNEKCPKCTQGRAVPAEQPPRFVRRLQPLSGLRLHAALGWARRRADEAWARIRRPAWRYY